MAAEADRIPAIEVYRGCRIHDEQPRERIETIVKREIDQVFGISEPQRLFEICGDVGWSPEARLLCQARLMGVWELATEGRMPRPVGLSLEQIKANTAGLDSIAWRDPDRFCSVLDVEWRTPVEVRGADYRGAVLRETPLP
jgi:hypothetical protein